MPWVKSNELAVSRRIKVMKKNIIYINKAEEYIDLILQSNFNDNNILKKEFPGIIEHDKEDPTIAKEIYTKLKKICRDYRKGIVSSSELSDFCSKVMFSKYSPKVVSKIVNDDIYNALDFISELDFNKKQIKENL